MSTFVVAHPYLSAYVTLMVLTTAILALHPKIEVKITLADERVFDMKLVLAFLYGIVWPLYLALMVAEKIWTPRRVLQKLGIDTDGFWWPSSTSPNVLIEGLQCEYPEDCAVGKTLAGRPVGDRWRMLLIHYPPTADGGIETWKLIAKDRNRQSVVLNLASGLEAWESYRRATDVDLDAALILRTLRLRGNGPPAQALVGPFFDPNAFLDYFGSWTEADRAQYAVLPEKIVGDLTDEQRAALAAKIHERGLVS